MASLLVPLLGSQARAVEAGCRPRAGSAWHLAAKAPRTGGWLLACPDSTLRTSKGRKIRLEGLEFVQSGWGNSGTGRCDAPYVFPPSFAAGDIAQWGFNAIQLFVSWQNLEPSPPTFDVLTGRLVHHYDHAYLALLDQTIARFRSQGVAVVLAMIQSRWSGAFQKIRSGDKIYPCGLGMPAWIYERNGKAAGSGRAMVRAQVRFYQNRAIVTGENGLGSEPMRLSFSKAWRYLARRYRYDSTVVGIVPMFESYDVLTRQYSGAQQVLPRTLGLARFFEQIGRVIHRANPRLLIFFTEQLSRSTGKWSLLRRPSVPNGVMTTEFYAGRWPTDGIRRFKAHLERARGWHYPFYVAEFDAFGRTRDMTHPRWRSDTSDMLAYCRLHHTSWTLLSYGAGSFQQPSDPRQARPILLRTVREGF